jgi:hypothetical protein
MISGFHCCVGEVFALLGCNALFIGTSQQCDIAEEGRLPFMLVNYNLLHKNVLLLTVMYLRIADHFRII